MILNTLLAFATFPIVISERCRNPFTAKSQRVAIGRFLARFSEHDGQFECLKQCVNNSYPCYTFTRAAGRCLNFDAKGRRIYVNMAPLLNSSGQYPRILTDTKSKNPPRQPRETNQYKQTQSLNLPSTSRKKRKKKGCYKGYTYLIELKICVKIHESRRSWNTARRICISEKSHLAIIKDARKNRILQAYVQSVHAIGYFWIGAKDAYKNNTFFWLDYTKMMYSNWAFNEPSHKFFKTDEDCVFMRASMKWNDSKCSQNWRFICETKPYT